MGSRHPGMPYRRGFTLTEIIIAIAVLALVMALLGLPLLSAFGYVQKATARGEAQRAGLQAAQQIERELAVAMYIFELPPDGTSVSYVKELADDAERSRGMAMNFSAGELVLCRYAQMPAFPWVWEYADASATVRSWVQMTPNYLKVNEADPLPYEKHYVPFHDPNRQGLPANPYTVMQLPEYSMSWASATVAALDARFPLGVETDLVRGMGLDQQRARDQLIRRKQNALFGVTPVGDVWDAPRFQVSPRRITGESLQFLTASTGLSLPTVARTSLPLIAGRSRVFDEVDPNQLIVVYNQPTIADLWNLVNASSPLYPKDAINPKDTNPFGYQLRVFDSAGGMVYGVTGYSSTTGTGRLVTSRHFMDWPPCDRPDWDTSNPLWTEADIARQRLEGKFVFAQPMRNDDPLDVVTTTGNPTSRLPVPTGGGWIDAITYLVTPPRVMTLRSATTGTQKTFTRVSSATALGPGKFYCPNLGAYDASSRIIEFGEAMVDDQWTVVRPDGTPTFVTYTICDLQPKDTVVATYSSKAMLDLALTVSRKDYAARTPETSRQDFNVTRSIEAKNAAKRARRDDR